MKTRLMADEKSREGQNAAKNILAAGHRRLAVGIPVL